jgi:AmmeMemoRadiSam system protein B
MRSPIALGFYPFGKEELEKQVRKYLVSEKEVHAMGLIAPHAGYEFSGSVAGATFKTAKTYKQRFVLLGPNHSGYGPAVAASKEEWKTPLGTVKPDTALIKRLNEKIRIDESAHLYEHSLEVQIPFLQILYNNFSILPVCLGHVGFDELEKLSEYLAFDDCFYVTSSDFIHFGPNYGYTPVSGTIDDQLRWVKNRDKELADAICRLEAKRFYQSVVSNGYTVCGFVPITLLMLIMKKLGAKKGNLIKYKTSYDVHPDSSFVSYVGIVFE